MTSLSDNDPKQRLSQRYRNFAEYEARGSSPLYEELAYAVAETEPLLDFILSLPEPKQQPNLVFAAMRHLYGTPENAADLIKAVDSHPEAIRSLILQRSTQTNEPARCATLVPVLASLRQPLALLEVGAAAGLCLLLDYYGYDYGRRQLEPRRRVSSEPPVFPCDVNAETPIPDELPDVVWRAGLDLNPIDVSNPEETRWLETLVWPGQPERAIRLHQAIRIAQDVHVPVIKGDLLTAIPDLAASAPKDATLVIFHSSVLVYLEADPRDAFMNHVQELPAVWISNESPGVFPTIAAKLEREIPESAFSYLQALDGEPMALAGRHGQFVRWLAI